MFRPKLYGVDDLVIKHPATLIVSGPSGSGKSELTRSIINNFPLTTSIKKDRVKVMWAYSMIESLRPLSSPNVLVSFFEGVPTIKQIREEAPDILVLDDLLMSAAKDNGIADLFIKGSHHLNLTIFFLVQNIFANGRNMRNISLQAKYLIFMKSMRDEQQFKVIARQTPIPYDRLVSAYRTATDPAFGYLVLDLTQDTPLDLRLRSKITPRYLPGYNQPVFAPTVFK
jgi:hypothetical protein